jgi:hypothetical protein
MLALAIADLIAEPNESDTFVPARGYYVSASYSASSSESLRVVRVLEELGYVASREHKAAPGFASRTSRIYSVTARGHLFAEDQAKSAESSTRGFAAMWFDATMDDAWTEAISLAITDAGFDPVRVDRVEHLNRIDDEILNQINAAKFVVADFTGHRSGVYFEAGYALGRGLPVVWTCRSDELDKLHFDIRQYNCIAWSSLADLRRRLSHRIRSTVGVGPRKLITAEFDELLG